MTFVHSSRKKQSMLNIFLEVNELKPLTFIIIKCVVVFFSALDRLGFTDYRQDAEAVLKGFINTPKYIFISVALFVICTGIN